LNKIRILEIFKLRRRGFGRSSNSVEVEILRDTHTR